MFIRIGTRRIRYKAADVMAWLDERRHRCTSEYMKPKPPGVSKEGTR